MSNNITNFQDLPPEVQTLIFSRIIAAPKDLSLRSVCSTWDRLICEENLRMIWQSLKNDPPAGPVDLNGRMKTIEDAEPKGTYLKFFKELSLTIQRNFRLPIEVLPPLLNAPFLPSDYRLLQTQIQDESLEAIWPKIQAVLQLENPPKTAGEIRVWLNHPDNAEALKQITSLDLSGLFLKYLPPEIGNLTALEILNLNGNQLTSLPESLGNLTALRGLGLNGNHLSSLPESFGQLAALRWLNLENNRLSSLPESFGDLTVLEELRLSKNRLSSLPESFGRLAALRQLYLRNNRLSSLPEFFGNLTALQSLGLSSNRLLSLPDSFGQLAALQELGLDRNRLRSLPGSFGNLAALRRLYLTNNQLSSLPESFGNLIALLQLNLRGNSFTFIPDAVLQSQNPVISSNPTIVAFKEEQRNQEPNFFDDATWDNALPLHSRNWDEDSEIALDEATAEAKRAREEKKILHLMLNGKKGMRKSIKYKITR